MAARLRALDEQDPHEQTRKTELKLARVADALAAKDLVKVHSESAPEAANGNAFEFIRGRDLFQKLPATPWLCEGLEMAPGAPSIWAGFGFSGKTMAAQSLALAVASGRDAWGSLAVRQGRVVHFDYEQGRSLTLKRYQKLAQGLGIGPDDIGENLEVALLPTVSLGAEGIEVKLIEKCAGVALCIVDSFRAACPEVDENSSEARRPLDMLNRVSEATGCSFLVIHHSRKPSKDSTGGAKMSMRGSGALFDACASVFIFGGGKDEPITLQHEKARISGKPRDDFAIEIRDLTDPDGRFDGVEVVTTALEAHAKPSPSERSDKVQSGIRAALSAGPLGANQLEQACRDAGVVFTAGAFRCARNAMVEGGDLVTEPGPNRSQLYRLSEGSP